MNPTELVFPPNIHLTLLIKDKKRQALHIQAKSTRSCSCPPTESPLLVYTVHPKQTPNTQCSQRLSVSEQYIYTLMPDACWLTRTRLKEVATEEMSLTLHFSSGYPIACQLYWSILMIVSPNTVSINPAHIYSLYKVILIPSSSRQNHLSAPCWTHLTTLQSTSSTPTTILSLANMLSLFAHPSCKWFFFSLFLFKFLPLEDVFSLFS